MISPNTVPGHMGFSPQPAPKLIATYHTHGPAVAVSRGLDRDRVADETGNQTVVFGRRGSRPFNLQEMKSFYDRPTSTKSPGVFQVEDVSFRDGKLWTRSGRELLPKLQPITEQESPVATAHPQRLIRRGQ
jgi:hypothetical protein